MVWTTSVWDLRIALSDQHIDKLRFQKQVFGDINGANLLYKTMEFRRVTNFTAATSQTYNLGVFLNNQLLPTTAVTFDDNYQGWFTLASAPTAGQSLTASYYIQWFTDYELTDFLNMAANWIGTTTDITMLDPGLIPAALKYGCYQAYQKLSLKYAESISETFRLEDSPEEKRFAIVDVYTKAASQSLKEATMLRDDFYKNRKGQALAPISMSIVGNVNDVTPRS
jgi:hypothetical protein